MDMLATTAGGDYFSITKIIVLLVLIVPWLLAAPWIDKDTVRVRVHRGLWNASVIGAGTLSLLIWLLTPLFVAGLLIYLVITAGMLGAYVAYRNGRVPPELKVLTRDHIMSSLKGQKVEKAVIQTRVKLYASNGKIILAPDPNTATSEEVQAYNLAQELLYSILWHRASEADISPIGSQARVRFVIDGVVNDRPPMDAADSEAITQYLKPVAGMIAEDRRKPQRGRLSVDVAGKPVEMVLVVAVTTTGQRLQFRIVQELVRTQLGELGMSEDVLASIRKHIVEDTGLIIVAGRPGNGVTSTLYSILREMDAFTKQLITLESKVTVDLENITQNEYGDAANLPDELASALRRDPDVIVVDQCPSNETASIIQEAASQKLILTGMRASDTFSALGKWVQLNGGSKAATGALAHLKGILCQVLVRKLCPNCRESYPPDPAVMTKLNLAARRIDRLYRPPTHPVVDEKGRPIICSTCQGNGYFGRTAVFEWMEMTDEIRQTILSGGTMMQIKAACRKNKMLYIQEQALRKVLDGITGIAEILRISEKKNTEAKA